MENEAQASKRGLWIDNKPVPRWEYRKLNAMADIRRSRNYYTFSFEMAVEFTIVERLHLLLLGTALFAGNVLATVVEVFAAVSECDIGMGPMIVKVAAITPAAKVK